MAAEYQDADGGVSQLVRIRRRQRFAYAPAVALIVIYLATLAERWLTGTPSVWLIAAVTLIIPVAAACAMFVPLAKLRCPRCDRSYFTGPRYRNTFAQECQWCGLRLNGSNIGESYVLKW